MSDSDSEKSIKLTPVIEDKFNGYKCDKCAYKTKRIKNFINHITRKVPCDTVKNYDYGVQKAMEKYEKKSKVILDMLEKIELGEEVDIKKLNNLVNEVEILGRINPNFRQADVDEIREIIKENKK